MPSRRRRRRRPTRRASRPTWPRHAPNWPTPRAASPNSRGLAEEDRHLQALRIGGGEAGTPRLGVLLGVDEQSGVRIVGVTPGGGADKAGLKAGDRLLRIRGQAIAGGTGEARVASAREALARLEAGSPVPLTYQRDGRQHEVAVAPPRPSAWSSPAA